MSQVAAIAIISAVLVAGLIALEITFRSWERKVADEIDAGQTHDDRRLTSDLRVDLTWDAVSKRAEGLTREQQVTVMERIKVLSVTERSEGELITMALALIDKMAREVKT